MLTKSQQVRQYQAERYATRGAARFDKFKPTHALVEKGNPEFNPDQPRDEQGRWTAGGALAATLLGGAAIAGGVALGRNPKLLRQGVDAAQRGFDAARQRLSQMTTAPTPRRARGPRSPKTPAGPKPTIAALRRMRDEMRDVQIPRMEASYREAKRQYEIALRQLKNIRATAGNMVSLRTQAERVARLKEQFRWAADDLHGGRLRLSDLNARLRRGANKRAGTLFDKYRPDQARDQEGQFADEGGGRASAGPTRSGRSRKPKETDVAPPPAEGSAFGGDKWALARELGINAALIGATIYGGPAIGSAGRATAAGGRRVGRNLLEAYQRMRQRFRPMRGA